MRAQNQRKGVSVGEREADDEAETQSGIDYEDQEGHRERGIVRVLEKKKLRTTVGMKRTDKNRRTWTGRQRERER